jgi:hypothetical protein
VADGVHEGRFETLLSEEPPDRPKHVLGVRFVVLAHELHADECSCAVRHGEDAVDDGVFVLLAEQLVMCREIRQHALRVDAAVDGDQDLHESSS